MKLRSKENSPFEILGVDLNTTDEEVKKAYRRLAMKFHPDRNASEQAENQFKRVQTAYQLIKTESSRNQVKELLQIYGVYGSPTGGEHGGPGQQAYHPPGYEYKRTAYFIEFFLWVTIMLRWERVPLKLVFFLPFTLTCYHYLHPVGIHITTVSFAAWQSLVAAFVTDFLLYYVKTTNRYRLRLKVNNFVLITLMSTLALMLLTYFGEYQNPPLYLYGSDPEYMYAIALLISSVGFYAWIVFCFIFQRHDPTWESSMVYIGVAALLYMLVFQL